MRRVYIIGDDNTVTSDASGIVLINCDGETVTSDDSGKTILNNRKVIIGEDGGNFQLSYETKTSSFTVEAGNKGTYYVDCTAGDIDVTLQADANYPVWIVREDASANTIYLIAGTGTINGLGQIEMNSQFQKYSILFNGTNFRA